MENRINKIAKEFSEQNGTLKYYSENIKRTLKGWQPKVFVLNAFVKDLREELNNLPLKDSLGNLELIDWLINRDIDYVVDSEYINCIKFILERWHPELIHMKQYIKYAYQNLNLINEPFESESGFM